MRASRGQTAQGLGARDSVALAGTDDGEAGGGCRQARPYRPRSSSQEQRGTTEVRREGGTLEGEAFEETRLCHGEQIKRGQAGTPGGTPGGKLPRGSRSKDGGGDGRPDCLRR